MRKILATLSALFILCSAQAQWNTNSISQYETLLIGTNGTLAAFITNFFVVNSNLLNQSVNLSAGPANNATLLNAIIGTASLVSTNSTNSSFAGISFVTNLAGPTPFFWISNNVNTNVTSYTASFLGLSNIVATLQFGNSSLSNIASFVTVDASANITAHNFTGVTFSGNNELLTGLSAKPTLVLSNQTTSDNLMTWNTSGNTSGGWIDPLGGLNLPANAGISNASGSWGISSNAAVTISNLTIFRPSGLTNNALTIYSNGFPAINIDANFSLHVARGSQTNVALGPYGNATNGIYFLNGTQVAIVNSGVVTLLAASNVVYGNTELFNAGLFTNLYGLNSSITNLAISTGWATNLTLTNASFLGTMTFTGLTNSTLSVANGTATNSWGPFGDTNLVGGVVVYQQDQNGNVLVGGTHAVVGNQTVRGNGYANVLVATNAISFANGMTVIPFGGTSMDFVNSSVSSSQFAFSSGPLVGNLGNGQVLAALFTGAYTNLSGTAGIDLSGFGTLSNLTVLSSVTVKTNMTLGSLTNINQNFGVGPNGLTTTSNLLVTSSATVSSNLSVNGVESTTVPFTTGAFTNWVYRTFTVGNIGSSNTTSFFIGDGDTQSSSATMWYSNAWPFSVGNGTNQRAVVTLTTISGSAISGIGTVLTTNQWTFCFTNVPSSGAGIDYQNTSGYLGSIGGPPTITPTANSTGFAISFGPTSSLAMHWTYEGEMQAAY